MLKTRKQDIGRRGGSKKRRGQRKISARVCRGRSGGE